MIYAFYIPGMPFDGSSIARGESLGGSESAGLYLARELAARGHDVHVFADIPQQRAGEHDGVHYLPMGPRADPTPFGRTFHQFVATVPHDVLVCQRSPGALHSARGSKVNLWWIHDIALKRHNPSLAHMLWNTDGILTPSEFHAGQAAEVYGVPRERFHVVRNAIDPALFGEPPDPARKQRGKTLIYSSRPERGLEHLVREGGIMERLWKADPEIRLLVCGYDHVTDDMRGYYEQLFERCRELPNVTAAGTLSKQALAETMRGAWLHVYPTEFEETSCITAMEEMAAGTPFVTRDVGALRETLGKSRGAVWVKGAGVDAEAFCAAILRLRDRPAEWAKLHRAALENAKRFRWADSAAALEEVVERTLAERCARPARLARHLVQAGEIMALREFLPQLNGDVAADPILRRTAEELRTCYDFVEQGDYRGHYEAFYESEKAKGIRYGIEDVRGDPRFKATLRILRQVAPGSVVLDWGCAHGPQTNSLANELPALRFVGVELVADNVRIAREWAAQWELDNVEYLTVDEFMGRAYTEPTFDVVMCQEVLEHTPDAAAQVDALVPYVRPEGLWILSTPTGPVEYISRIGPRWRHDWRWRGHIQHLEMGDLRRLFGHHPGFNLEHIHWQSWRDHPVGWHLVTFRTPTEPSGKRDLGYTLRTQAPEETLSVCMICRADTGSLAKTLERLRWHVGQVVIGIDMGAQANGPKDGRAWAIAEEFGAEAFGIVSPLIQGFAAARNETLERAAGDWILWIDDDEDLVWPERLHKYLRPNHYDGYAVRQHHYALEPAGVIKTDLPLRLFRNRRGFRFHGIVHEHPELAFNAGAGNVFLLPDVAIAHNGYETEQGRRERFQRNWPLMQRDHAENPERQLGRFLWLRDLAHINRFEAERLGGYGPDARARCEEGIALWRSFAEKGEVRFVVDGLPYYSELVRQLTGGQAIEFSTVYRVRRANIGGETRNPAAETQRESDPVVTGQFLDVADIKRFTDCIRNDLLQSVEGGRYF